jgi:hypothetical protein
MPSNRAEDIYLGSAVAQIAKTKGKLQPKHLVRAKNQIMLAQSHLASLKLQTFEHKTLSTQLPISELHQKQMKLPGINGSQAMFRKVHRNSFQQSKTKHSLEQKENSLNFCQGGFPLCHHVCKYTVKR